MNFEDFAKYINSLDPNTTIGIHGINGDGNYLEKANSILKSGLETKNWGGILSNVSIFGQVKNLTETEYQRMREYTYNSDKNGSVVNVVLAFPETIVNDDGQEYFLGHFNPTTSNEFAKGSAESGARLPLNKMVNLKKVIPREFIAGYCTGKMESNDFNFQMNPSFYLNNGNSITEEVKQALIAESFGNIEIVFKNIELLKQYGYGEYCNQLKEYVENKEKKIK